MSLPLESQLFCLTRVSNFNLSGHHALGVTPPQKGHPEPKRGADGKLLRDSKGRIMASLEGPLQTTDVGIPDPDAFKKDGKLYFIQTDFLWSIPFRAKEEQKPPGAHCRF